MNKDNAKDFINLVHSLSYGYEIEHLNVSTGEWEDIKEISFDDKPSNYRVKKLKRYIVTCYWYEMGSLMYQTSITRGLSSSFPFQSDRFYSLEELKEIWAERVESQKLDGFRMIINEIETEPTITDHEDNLEA